MSQEIIKSPAHWKKKAAAAALLYQIHQILMNYNADLL